MEDMLLQYSLLSLLEENISFFFCLSTYYSVVYIISAWQYIKYKQQDIVVHKTNFSYWIVFQLFFPE